MHRTTLLGAACLLSIGAAGCPRPGPLSGPPRLEDVPGMGKCDVSHPNLDPMVVEWAGTRRSNLHRQLQQGLVVVAYEGCNLRVLEGCSAPANYAYGGLSASSETWNISSKDELYARLPIAAMALQGEFSQAKGLQLAYSLVGWYGAVLRPSLGRSDLVGDKACEGATHFVRRVQLGAFQLSSASRSKLGAGATIAGISTEGAESVVREGGSLASCKGNKTSPEEGCDVPVQLQLVPITEGTTAALTCAAGEDLLVDSCVPASTTCPAGLQWNGTRCTGKICPSGADLVGNECVRKEQLTRVECPAGTSWNGKTCQGAAQVTCPAGAQEVDGVCVHRVVVTQVDCPSGSRWNGRSCSPVAALSCPPGAAFVSGKGCVEGEHPRETNAQSQAPVTAAPVLSCPSGMVLLRGGNLRMGSPSGRPNELPVHSVAVKGFCLDRLEVTTDDYSRCVAAKACEPASKAVFFSGMNDVDKAMSRFCNAGQPGRDNHPVNCVDWAMATAYCQWAYKRLPTEEEWEFAARGPEGRAYPWGDSEPTAGRLNGCGSECVNVLSELGAKVEALHNTADGHPGTSPVGAFLEGRTPDGILDLAGNVWEWTSSWYGPYPDIASSGTDRVYRGGGWNYGQAEAFRGSRRGHFDPSMKTFNVGFRCAR